MPIGAAYNRATTIPFVGKFVGPWLKMIRAGEHARELDMIAAGFLDQNPHEIFAEFNPETTEHVFRVRVHRQPPPIIGILAGDVAHAMRSALDYAIGESIAANIGSWPSSHQKFEFPIFDSPAKYSSARRKNDGLADAALPLLEAMQPYYTANNVRGLLLWQLHRLDIEEKHRQLVAVAGGVATTRLAHIGKGGAAAFSVPDQPFMQFPLEDGGVVLRFCSAPDPESKIELDLQDWVALQNPAEVSGQPIVPLLARIFDEVKSRLTELEALLP